MVDAAALQGALVHLINASQSTNYWPVLLEQRLHHPEALLSCWLATPAFWALAEPRSGIHDSLYMGYL